MCSISCLLFFYGQTLLEPRRLFSYRNLLFRPTLILLPPGGLGVEGGSEKMLELKLAPKILAVLALNGLALKGLVVGDPWEKDRRPL